MPRILACAQAESARSNLMLRVFLQIDVRRRRSVHEPRNGCADGRARGQFASACEAAFVRRRNFASEPAARLSSFRCDHRDVPAHGSGERGGNDASQFGTFIHGAFGGDIGSPVRLSRIYPFWAGSDNLIGIKEPARRGDARRAGLVQDFILQRPGRCTSAMPRALENAGREFVPHL